MVEQLDRLPDEVVLIIINKLFHLKTLILFSLVAKRYSSLVSLTHSLFLDLAANDDDITTCADQAPSPSLLARMAGFVKSVVLKATSTSSGASSSTYPKSPVLRKLLSVIRHFKQIKHIHLHSPSSSVVKPSGGIFFTHMAVFGSHHLELFHLVLAASVLHRSDCYQAATANATDYMHRLRHAPSKFWLARAEGMLREASKRQRAIRSLVERCTMVETALFSDNSSGWTLFMGNQEEAATELELSLVVSHVPTLDLPESGYTMRNVVLLSAFCPPQAADHRVQLMHSQAKEMADGGGGPDELEVDKWGLLLEAAALISNHRNREPLHTWLCPYEQLVPKHLD